MLNNMRNLAKTMKNRSISYQVGLCQRGYHTNEFRTLRHQAINTQNTDIVRGPFRPAYIRREPPQWTMQMNLVNGSRQFSSSSEDPEKKKSSNDYESGFEKLMSEGKITKEESERF